MALRPSALAMVWPGVGKKHEPVAVPGIALAPGEVLVSVELATVCPRDAQYASGARLLRGPVVLGHEAVGRVVALAGPVRAAGGRRLSVGSRVVWSATASCGRCGRCRHGMSQRCVSLHRYGHERVARDWQLGGAFATHVQLRKGTTIVLVPDNVPAEVLAPIACAGAAAAAIVEAAEREAPLAKRTVHIAGTSARALTAAAMAADAGARVLLTETDSERRELARRFGAVAVVDSQQIGSDGLGTEGAHSIMPQGEQDAAAPRHLVRAVDFVLKTWRELPYDEFVGEVMGLEGVDDALRLAASEPRARVGLRNERIDIV
ncbi:alcohol dehydrogenase catalytic domain-containing protein [Compostimonas suwonensis]|uniref:alcohol dehydrogenase catalytic domain-containing protein n=1 Tax=Compostimonas suwonensis TaxID=1048394 RepID=UPI003CCBC810